MKRTAILAALMLTLAGSGMTGQNLPENADMVCTTTDGIIRISDNGFTLVNYNFICDDVLKDGVATFSDPASGANAVLDARSDQGLFITVFENDIKMLVVVDRKEIKYNTSQSTHFQPSYSFSLNVFTPKAKKHIDE